ncbi:hypothetical protein H4Q26_018155 [Puccinia striiformis f. sp. tritici PST-130]|nr:hypothetical protein Pst134EB_010835 [Puccinia striiformis f. sp. tritici]KAI9628243.1 hypothetical protein H4Q26_018155 [Puccinia striiformis f. sp. tritici PST-130]
MALQQTLNPPLQPVSQSWIAARLDLFENMALEQTKRRVKALLTTLTHKHLDSISDQLVVDIKNLGNKNDDRIVRLMVVLIFEQVSEPGECSELYAELCQQLMDKWSLEVDCVISDDNGRKRHTGQCLSCHLFRQWNLEYLRRSTRRAELETVRAAVYAPQENLRPEADTGKDVVDPAERVETLSDDYDARQKISKRCFALFCFMGELYKRNIFTDHEIKTSAANLLLNYERSQAKHIEYFAYLIMIVGPQLDQPRAENFMKILFNRLDKVTQIYSLSSSHRFLIEDIFDARKNEWVACEVTACPTPETTPSISRADLPELAFGKWEFHARRKDGNGITEFFRDDGAWSPTDIWTDEHKKALLEAVLDQHHLEFGTVNGYILTQGWTSVIELMTKKFDVAFHDELLEKEMLGIRETYLDVKFLSNQPDFRWDDERSRLTAVAASWDKLIEKHPNASYLLHKPIEWYSLAERVFGTTRTTENQLPYSLSSSKKTPSPPSVGIFTKAMSPRGNKRIREVISPDDDSGGIHTGSPCPPSRASKQPRRSEHGLLSGNICRGQ